MNYLVFDLETVVDDDARFKPKEPDQFPPPIAHRIVCFGVMWLKVGKVLAPESWATLPTEEQEQAAVDKIFRLLTRDDVTIVGWNSRGFDVPVLLSRALKYGISIPKYFTNKFGARYRYSEEGHLDLMDQMVDFGAGSRPKLLYASRLIGMPVKVEAEGGGVQELVTLGHTAALERYCLSDVLATATLLVRWLRLRGTLSETNHDAMMQAIVSVVENDERFESLREEIEPERLVLWSGS